MLKLVGLLICLTLVLSLVACKSANTPETQLGREFTLAIKSATIVSENLSVKFLDVTEDSRCPKNVTCIQVGRVTCAVEVTKNGQTKTVSISQPGLTDETVSQSLDGYNAKFTVEPYPEAGKQIAKSDYRLRMTVDGRNFTLAIGQSATIVDEKLGIKFLDVTEDSRCPKNVTCIWEGRVTCSLEVTKDGLKESVNLTQPGLTDAAAGQPLDGYTARFTVAPYPEAGKQIAKSDYRLRMTVSK
jgi:hypothetical protein